VTRAGRSVRRGEEDYVNRARFAIETLSIGNPRVVTEKVRDKHIILDMKNPAA